MTIDFSRLSFRCLGALTLCTSLAACGFGGSRLASEADGGTAAPGRDAALDPALGDAGLADAAVGDAGDTSDPCGPDLCGEPCATDEDCGDSDPCDGTASCVAGRCAPGPAIPEGAACGDGACTAGRCEAPDAFVHVSFSDDMGCGAHASGQVSCWGRAVVRPDGTLRDSPVPVEIAGVTDIVQVVALSVFKACGLTRSGSVMCWGGYSRGVDGAPDPGSSPHVRPDVSGVVQLAGAHDTTCALLDDGRVACWGMNSHGQLGVPSSGPGDIRLRAVIVEGLDEAVHVDVSSVAACAVRRSGDVWCWGALGARTPSRPAPVAGFTNAAEVAVGDDHICARTREGLVSCRGQLEQLGSGRDPLRTYPTFFEVPEAVVGLTDAVALDAGKMGTCALRRGGQVVCWGHQPVLGVAGMGIAMEPVPVLDGVRWLVVDTLTACVRREAGDLVAWGLDPAGRAELSRPSTHLEPTAMPDLP